MLPQNCMENRRRKSSSGENFSFPIIPIQDQELYEFEFGCVTPGSPNSSPADHLFFNGQLLPHSFPLQKTNTSTNYSRSISRTSSVSSKESFMSSRSNSTNSLSSNSSSARTSTSTETCDRNNTMTHQSTKFASKTMYNSANKPVYITPQYGSSKRWQFISPAPVLKHQVSCRKKADTVREEEDQLRAKKQGNKGGANTGFGRRILRSFVLACSDCHAMNPSGSSQESM